MTKSLSGGFSRHAASRVTRTIQCGYGEAQRHMMAVLAPHLCQALALSDAIDFTTTSKGNICGTIKEGDFLLRQRSCRPPRPTRQLPGSYQRTGRRRPPACRHHRAHAAVLGSAVERVQAAACVAGAVGRPGRTLPPVLPFPASGRWWRPRSSCDRRSGTLLQIENCWGAFWAGAAARTTGDVGRQRRPHLQGRRRRGAHRSTRPPVR